MSTSVRVRPLIGLIVLMGVLLFIALGGMPASVLADHTPNPTTVTIPGSLQSELGCSGDWQPDCSVTYLTYDANDDVWQNTFSVPAGNWEYKAALNDSWDENYGLNATSGGANIPLSLAQQTDVKFYYDHKTHWVTDNQNSVIATAPGSYQSEIGCPGDWQPDCLRSWLQDPDGDGTYSFATDQIPAGNYEVKVAIDEDWAENYGDGGQPNGANIPFSVPQDGLTVTFTYDPITHILTVDNGTGAQGNINEQSAYWVSQNTIAWSAANDPSLTYQLYYVADGGMTLEAEGVTGGNAITLAPDMTGISDESRQQFPHLATLPALTIPDDALNLVPDILKGQIAIAAINSDGRTVDATGLQIPGVLDDLYTYGGDLGVVWDGDTPTINLWAPTAKAVTFHLFDDSDPATTSTTTPMTLDPETGVWSISGDSSWKGKYYLYEVEVYVHSTGQVEHNIVTDPYSFSLAMNSTRSQIVDLNDADLKPAGWDDVEKPTLDAFEDISLYELHVRDFSAWDDTVPEEYRGTFKAFTLEDTNGVNHLKALADAGLTHLHLLPSFDIATINENKSEWQQPDFDLLATYPPDSDQQQAAVTAVNDLDPFNWGYDPFHYTVPEGSYSTDPDGPARIVEFREMVQSLNEDVGLRVVMDVVYNHTNASGQAEKSVLDRIVPGYYHRLSSRGTVENSTCCANTATEHNMMEKLMVDSLVTWATQYKVDGFRFDLMGHHMLRNMTNVRAALDALTLEDDGVDGSKIYIYGEGWNFGEVADNARGINATQLNVGGLGIGTFSDRLRDAVRGGGPFDTGVDLRKQGFANGLYYDPNSTDQGDALATLLLNSDQVRVGLAGNLADYQFVDRTGAVVTGSQVDYNGQPAGYTKDPQEDITYIAAHDNQTLYDKNTYAAPTGTSMEDRVRIQSVGMSTAALGQGVPFFHAGMDVLRSKSFDRDSFNSGDWFNKLDFTYESNNFGVGLPPASHNQDNWDIMQPFLADTSLQPAKDDIVRTNAMFRELLQIRYSSELFRLETRAEIQERVRFYNTGPNQIPGLIVMSVTDLPWPDVDSGHEYVVVLFNANDEAQTVTVGDVAGRELILHPVQQNSVDDVVKTASFDAGSGTFTVPGRTTAVFVEVQPSPETLMADVDALVEAGVLDSGQGSSLKAKLQAAQEPLDRGQTHTAINQLNAFINEVEAMMRSGRLSSEQGQALIDDVNVIIQHLDPPPPPEPEPVPANDPDDEALVRAPVEHPVEDQVFYFVMADRFNDANSGNNVGDDPGGTTEEDILRHGYLPTDKGYYHGGDIAGLTEQLDYLEDLGITAIWMTPMFKNNPVQTEVAGENRIESSSAGYHGYWITDFTQVDPHFGTNDELRTLIDAAHDRGMLVFFDIITNHTADIIDYEEGQYSYISKEDAPYRDADGNVFDDADYAGTDTFPELDPETSFPYTPVFRTPEDATVKVPDWLNDVTNYHNRGNSTFVGENSLYGDFFGLDDLFTEQPDVVDGMIDIYKFWISEFGIDGFRIDTAKHVNLEFWQEWSPTIMDHARAEGKEDFYMFGEVFDSNPAFMSIYSTAGKLPATLDFGIQSRAAGFAVSGNATNALRDFFADDDYYTDIDSNAYGVGNFIGNHDMGRVGFMLRSQQGGASRVEWLLRSELGHSLLYFARGFPIVYYGDEQGFTGDGGDKDAREDMFPSQVDVYNDNPLMGTVASTAENNFDQDHPLYETLGGYSALFREHEALRRGAQIHRYSRDAAGVYAFSRVDRDEKVEYVIALNNAEAPQRVTFETYMADTEFEPLYPAGARAVSTNAFKEITLEVQPLDFVVYRATEPVPASLRAPEVSFVAPDEGEEIYGRAEVGVTLSDDNVFAEVTFAVKVGDADEYTVIGTDTNAPYRVFYDVSDFAVGTPLEFKAVVSDLSGHVQSATRSAVVGVDPSTIPDAGYAVLHYNRPAGDYTDWGLHLWGDAIDPSEVTEWTSPKLPNGEDAYGKFFYVKLQDPSQPLNFIVHKGDEKDTPDDRSFVPADSREVWLMQDDATNYPNQTEAQGYVTIHYKRPAGDYDGWGLHLWGDGLDPSEVTTWDAPKLPDGFDDYGAYFTVQIQDVTQPVNFIIHKGDEKDTPDDRSFDPVAYPDLWLIQDDASNYAQPGAVEDYAVIHYHRDDGDYGDSTSSDFNDFWGLHVWTGAASPTEWTSPLTPAGTDDFGIFFKVDLAPGASSLSYIIHRGDQKDLPDDQSLDVSDSGYEVWVLSGRSEYLLPMEENTATVTAQQSDGDLMLRSPFRVILPLSLN